MQPPHHMLVCGNYERIHMCAVLRIALRVKYRLELICVKHFLHPKFVVRRGSVKDFYILVVHLVRGVLANMFSARRFVALCFAAVLLDPIV